MSLLVFNIDFFSGFYPPAAFSGPASASFLFIPLPGKLLSILIIIQNQIQISVIFKTHNYRVIEIVDKIVFLVKKKKTDSIPTEQIEYILTIIPQFANTRAITKTPSHGLNRFIARQIYHKL